METRPFEDIIGGFYLKSAQSQSGLHVFIGYGGKNLATPNWRAPMRAGLRMLGEIIERLVGLVVSGNLLDLSSFFGFAQRRDENTR